MGCEMYLRRIELENTGPIDLTNYHFPFNEDGNPKPVVFVGRNGAGKSILISHIVNAMIVAKGSVFSDSEVEEGKVYKLRSPTYIRHGKDYYRAYVHFDDNFFQGEIQATYPRAQFESIKTYTPNDMNWSRMDMNSTSIFVSNFDEREAEVRERLSKSIMLYFPPNRFEEPAWLNIENLKSTASYRVDARMQGVSGRQIINSSPLRDNQNWLLDIVYDSYAVERKAHILPGHPLPFLLETNGPATQLRKAIEEFLLRLFSAEGPIQWGVGARGIRSISISQKQMPISNNLFSLSTGQTALLNIFLTLIRDCDNMEGNFNGLKEVKGIVVIDEVDAHLHTELQHTILPQLLSLFPKVQFVITTHSPLFILGMEKTLGGDGFALVELPNGNAISVERFSEFEAAYRHFKETTVFDRDMRAAISESHTPILFTEGSIDVDYLERAAQLLGRQDSLKDVRLLDANGFGGLDKIWKHFDTNIAQLTNRRVTLLYDCDINKSANSKPGVTRLVAPQQGHRIAKGIENLFPDGLIERARQANPAFIDVSPVFQRVVRGNAVEEPERWDVNVDEKRNLADWIIANGSAAEFAHFGILFDMIDAAKIGEKDGD